MRHLVVLSAGMSTPSTTSNLAAELSSAVRTQVAGRGEDISINHFEIKELLPELAKAYNNFGQPTPKLDEARKALALADGLIAVTPVFQGSYSGLFKMLFDVLDTHTLSGVPTIIGATAGTSRHSLMLEHAVRPLLSFMHALVVPTSVFMATEDYGSDAGQEVTNRVTQAATELAQLMVSNNQKVEGLAPSSPSRPSGAGISDDFQSMTELLRDYGGTN